MSGLFLLSRMTTNFVRRAFFHSSIPPSNSIAGVSSHYSWHSPGVENLSEKKRRAEERREELLVLLYRDNLTTSELNVFK